MRKAYLLVLLVPSAVAYACGGSGDDSLTDAGSDATTPTDSGNGGDTIIANDTGMPTDAANDNTQPMMDAGPADGTISISCVRPSNCIDGGNPDAAYPPDSGEVCCGTIVTSGTTSCTFVSATTTCAAPASCKTDFAMGCGSDTVRLCAANSECVETSMSIFNEADKCCTAKAGDASVHFCSNSTLASLSGGDIVCP